MTVEKSYLHKEIDFKKGMTAEYFDMCKKEIDAMRVRDPQEEDAQMKSCSNLMMHR